MDNTKRIAELERELATVCARSDISSFCLGRIQDGKQWWEEKLPKSGSKPVDAMIRRDVGRAIEYLELRNLIERHPRQKWIHILEPK